MHDTSSSAYTAAAGRVPIISQTLQGNGLQCSKEDLTDVFSWFLQVLLACLAFTCLIAKRFCEPKCRRRSWLIWFYDTSKQGIGALAIHMANVWLAAGYSGDTCTWYIINFLLDSSLGLLIVFVGIRSAQYLSRRKGWEAFNFGEYGFPPSMNYWIIQCFLYLILMLVVKLAIALFMQLQFWDSVKDFILSPFINPNIELIFVMLIIPFFVNLLMFWVTDNFLMHKNRTVDQNGGGILDRARLKYQSLKQRERDKRHDSESDTLLTDDEEEIIRFSIENLRT